MSEKPVIDLGHEENKRQAKQDEHERKKELSDLCFVLQSSEGRRVIWRLLSLTGAFKETFTGENNTSNYNQGRRSVGSSLFFDIMDASPESFPRLQREHKGEVARKEAARKQEK